MTVVPQPLTLTHARLRRDQGDVRGAVAIVEALIDAGREDDELWRLYVSLGGARHRPRQASDEAQAAAPQAASPEALRERFSAALSGAGPRAKAERLRRWLARIRRAEGLQRP